MCTCLAKHRQTKIDIDIDIEGAQPKDEKKLQTQELVEADTTGQTRRRSGQMTPDVASTFSNHVWPRRIPVPPYEIEHQTWCFGVDRQLSHATTLVLCEDGMAREGMVEPRVGIGDK